MVTESPFEMLASADVWKIAQWLAIIGMLVRLVWSVCSKVHMVNYEWRDELRRAVGDAKAESAAMRAMLQDQIRESTRVVNSSLEGVRNSAVKVQEGASGLVEKGEYIMYALGLIGLLSRLWRAMDGKDEAEKKEAKEPAVSKARRFVELVTMLVMVPVFIKLGFSKTTEAFGKMRLWGGMFLTFLGGVINLSGGLFSDPEAVQKAAEKTQEHVDRLGLGGVRTNGAGGSAGAAALSAEAIKKWPWNKGDALKPDTKEDEKGNLCEICKMRYLMGGGGQCDGCVLKAKKQAGEDDKKDGADGAGADFGLPETRYKPNWVPPAGWSRDQEAVAKKSADATITLNQHVLDIQNYVLEHKGMVFMAFMVALWFGYYFIAKAETADEQEKRKRGLKAAGRKTGGKPKAKPWYDVDDDDDADGDPGMDDGVPRRDDDFYGTGAKFHSGGDDRNYAFEKEKGLKLAFLGFRDGDDLYWAFTPSSMLPQGSLRGGHSFYRRLGCLPGYSENVMPPLNMKVTNITPVEKVVETPPVKQPKSQAADKAETRKVAAGVVGEKKAKQMKQYCFFGAACYSPQCVRLHPSGWSSSNAKAMDNARRKQEIELAAKLRKQRNAEKPKTAEAPQEKRKNKKKAQSVEKPVAKPAPACAEYLPLGGLVVNAESYQYHPHDQCSYCKTNGYSKANPAKTFHWCTQVSHMDTLLNGNVKEALFGRARVTAPLHSICKVSVGGAFVNGTLVSLPGGIRGMLTTAHVWENTGDAVPICVRLPNGVEKNLGRKDFKVSGPQQDLAFVPFQMDVDGKPNPDFEKCVFLKTGFTSQNPVTFTHFAFDDAKSADLTLSSGRLVFNVHSAATQPGHCGGPLIDHHNKCVVGIHVGTSASQKINVSLPITETTIAPWVSKN